MVTGLNFPWSSGRLRFDGCFLFNGHKVVPMVTQDPSVLTLISCHTLVPFSPFKEAEPVVLKLGCESESLLGLLEHGSPSGSGLGPDHSHFQ